MLRSGAVLQNRYRIISLLGEGGMGAVYRAWDNRLNIPVALKEMISHPGLSPENLIQWQQQFRREATILAQLDHPNLVGVTDFFQEDRNSYLVMEFVEGNSLVEYIYHQGPLLESQVLVWAEQLLDALSYCHSRDIIHRDIKPQNIIIRSDGQAVLVDFGLVKLWDPNDPRTQTAMRGMGTPQYAPPEQYGAFVGHTEPRSDLYALGATLYHALSGKVPAAATLRIANPEEFYSLQSIVRNVSRRTAEAVEKALELPSSNRWDTAVEMASALGCSVTDWTALPRYAASIEDGNSVKKGLQRWTLSWGWVAITLVLFVLGGGSIGFALWGDIASFPTFAPTLTPTQVKEQTPTAEAQSTMPGTDSESTSPPSTSTPRPTSTPSPMPATVIVGEGDSFHQICRDYCDGCWGKNEVPSDLQAYAKQIAEHNGKPWNLGDVRLVPGEELKMLPCPSHCP
jgi:eukaryotic-like serine/threonine-protein kinase